MRSATLPYVLRFATEMEAKLDANRHKGDRQGWLSCTPHSLLTRLKEEVQELEDAMRDGRFESAKGEAADVGNFAMMIADVVEQYFLTARAHRINDDAPTLAELVCLSCEGSGKWHNLAVDRVMFCATCKGRGKVPDVTKPNPEKQP